VFNLISVDTFPLTWADKLIILYLNFNTSHTNTHLILTFAGQNLSLLVIFCPKPYGVSMAFC